MRRQDLGRVEGFAPRRVHPGDDRAETARHFAHALTEDAVDPDDDRVAGSDEVDEGGLHAGRAGATEGQRQLVVGGEHDPEPLDRLVQDPEENRVEVAENGTHQRLGHLGIRIRRPRPHEQPVDGGHPRIVTASSTTAPERPPGAGGALH